MNIGDIIIDNDPRTCGRRLIIESFDGTTHIIAKPINNRTSATIHRKSRIARANIYPDSKPRKTGFTLQPNH